jgi:hypothetical protein
MEVNQQSVLVGVNLDFNGLGVPVQALLDTVELGLLLIFKFEPLRPRLVKKDQSRRANQVNDRLVPSTLLREMLSSMTLPTM